MDVEPATFRLVVQCLNQLSHPITLCNQPNERSCKYTLEGMFLDYLRKQAVMYNTNVDKEVKLLVLKYDKGDIYECHEHEPHFYKTKNRNT